MKQHISKVSYLSDIRLSIDRSSHPEVFCKKVFLEI